MDDNTSPTDVISTALAPAADATLAAATPGSDGVAEVAIDALQQSTGASTGADPLGEIIDGIPADDTDLQTITDQQQRELLTGMRGQLRTLGTAVRELTPLRTFQEFGDPEAVKPRLEVAKLLYSPVLDARGQPRRDPTTQLPLQTTLPLWQHLDKASPGMPEQAFVDLVNFQPMAEDGRTKEAKLGDQYLVFLGLNPDRLSEYKNIDALIARTSGSITAEELADIPAEYHAAYRTIPPSVRAAWKSYDEADQLHMLQDYKGRLDDAAAKEEGRKTALTAKATADAEYAQKVAGKTREYYQSVRTERFTKLYNSLAEQVVFSADPAVNEVMLGSLCSTLALMLDPEWRFVAEEHVLKPLGFKLGQNFDAVLGKFDSAAHNKVALEMAGDMGQSKTFEGDAASAVNQLMAILAPLALKIAVKQGATMTEKARTQAAALASATAARPGIGTGPGGNGNHQGVLPPGMVPGSREATDYIARQTGFFKDSASG